MTIPTSHQDILDSKSILHLASLGPDGQPEVHPVWFTWDGSHVKVSTTKARQKHRNIERDRRVAGTMLDPENDYRYLEVRGEVERIDEDPDGAFIDELAQKYLGQDRYPWAQPDDERVIYFIRVDKANTMG